MSAPVTLVARLMDYQRCLDPGQAICDRRTVDEAAVALSALVKALSAIIHSGHAISQPLRWEAEAAISQATGAA